MKSRVKSKVNSNANSDSQLISDSDVKGHPFRLSLLGFLRLVSAFIVGGTIAFQLIHNLLYSENYVVSHFFSYFTIQSNILLTLIFSVSGWKLLKKKSDLGFFLARGALTLYMVTTGLVYSVMIAGTETGANVPIPWVNAIFHYIMPVLVLVDWSASPSHHRISWTQALKWLLFPLAFLAYSLIRGFFVDWYPYGFIDPRINGYAPVAQMSVMITLGVFVLAVAIRLISNLKIHSSK